MFSGLPDGNLDEMAIKAENGRPKFGEEAGDEAAGGTLENGELAVLSQSWGGEERWVSASPGPLVNEAGCVGGGEVKETGGGGVGVRA